MPCASLQRQQLVPGQALALDHVSGDGDRILLAVPVNQASACVQPVVRIRLATAQAPPK